jgi:hypothetical protein
MRCVALALVVLLVACGAPSAVPTAPSDSHVAATYPQTDVPPQDETCADGSMPIPTRFRANTPFIDSEGCPMPRPTPPPPQAMPAQVPMPEVALKSATFAVSAGPVLRRVSTADFPDYAARDFGVSLMGFLDLARGNSRVNPYAQVSVSDDQWNSRIWSGPFQKIARAATNAKPATGRFFHLDRWRIDAAYSLSSDAALPAMPGVPGKGYQFVELTLEFRDHAEDPPAEGELWYTWHLRMPTAGTSMFAVADGYDGASARTWMNPGASYWSQALLETEATSAVAGYLWNESYVPGGNPQFAAARPTTPFWQKRVDGLNHLNELFAAKQLTERRFENTSVRIDRFEPLTFFAGGVVTVTITGRLVEVLNGKTIVENFSQPMKFFRFGGSGASISGWTAVDSQEDGVWLSGGNLALDKLETFHG